MENFIIQGGHKLQGDIEVKGAKNATTPILAATVLIQGECILHNVPRISDVETMLSIIKSMGGAAEWFADNSLRINCTDIDPTKIDLKLVKKIRSSILFMGCLAQRFGKFSMPLPGGCNIGSRPLDAHFDALRNLGYRCTLKNDLYTIERTTQPSKELVMSEFSVTATENVILASVIGDNKLTIKCCAAEHIVQDLCWFLNSAGAKIQGIASHTLQISGVSKLHGVEFTVMPDPIEMGTFIALGAVMQSPIRICNAAPEFLSLELRKFADAGVKIDFENIRSDALGKYQLATILPRKLHMLKALKKVHTMPYPGFAADLIQPFTLLMTQAQGITLIHDWMFDGRLRYVTELQKMGANITILDPHRITVMGPTPLYATEITSYDLRAGATLVLAGLLANGETTIKGIEQVDRGYEKLDERLSKLGARIKRAVNKND